MDNMLLTEQKHIEQYLETVEDVERVKALVIPNTEGDKYAIQFSCQDWKNTLGLHTQRNPTEVRCFATLDSAAKLLKSIGILQFTVCISGKYCE